VGGKKITRKRTRIKQYLIIDDFILTSNIRVFMILNEIIEKVPDYKEFLTIEELETSSVKLADEYETVELERIGNSGEGRPINYLKIGEGKKNALLFAFPHPNEPIGSMTVEFLSKHLAANPELVNELGYTWYLIKAIDPDGASLNEGWFKGKFTPLKYVKNYYRPPGHEQIEWTFPVEYKNLHFDNPPPETQALMHLIDKIKPDFMFSLHNAGFCGVYYYISHPKKTLYSQYENLVNRQNLPLHRGEPETPYIKKLAPAVFQMFGVSQSYDFYMENGVDDPSQIIRNGTSSDDYLRKVTDDQGFTLLCEMPYFYDKALGDNSLTDYYRRDLVVDANLFSKEMYEYLKPRFDAIRDYCPKNHRLYTTIEDSMDYFLKRYEPRMNNALNNPMYDGKATVAQAFDSMTAVRYYQTFRPAMTARLCEYAAMKSPGRAKMFIDLKEELDGFVEEKVSEVIEGSDFEVIPIKKLVKVQIGSALITMQSLQ
jgi:hypothetical protein